MKLALLTAAAILAVPAVAQAAPSDNAIQPSSYRFGTVPAGTHPTKVLTLRNPTSRAQWIHRFDLTGAGGNKFRLSFGRGMTCHVGTKLSPGETCTFRVRVATERPEFWQAVESVYYGSHYLDRPARGQWNGAVFAHVVAP